MKKIIISVLIIAVVLLMANAFYILQRHSGKAFGRKAYRAFTDGSPSLVRLMSINQKQFLRLELVTAARGLYQPLAKEIARIYEEGKGAPDPYELYLELYSRPEIIMTAIYDIETRCLRKNENFKLEQEVIDHLNETITDWLENGDRWKREYFGGFGGILSVKKGKIENGALLLLPRNVPVLEAGSIVVAIFNPFWITPQLPALMDSVSTHWLNFRSLLRPKIKVKYDFGFGLTFRQDTLYWKGDRGVEIADKNYLESITSTSSLFMAPDVDLHVIFGEREMYDSVVAMTSILMRMLSMNAFIAIVLTVGLILIVIQERLTINRMKQALVYLAHNIKTPIARIQLNAESLINGMSASPDEEKEILTTVSGECDRMTRTVMTAGMALKAKKIKPVASETDLVRLITGIRENWRKSYEHYGIGLEFKTDLKSLLLCIDPDKITIAMDQLIDNALRSIRRRQADSTIDKPHCRISIEDLGEKVVLSIRDTGIGIQKKKIFSQKSSSGSDYDFGYGLKIAKYMVKLHRGRLVGENVEGGARFTVELPI